MNEYAKPIRIIRDDERAKVVAEVLELAEHAPDFATIDGVRMRLGPRDRWVWEAGLRDTAERIRRFGGL